jgi:glycosyltransferase involved in cell wall biosynthesis
MTIGLDLSVIQTPHRMRGIGATAINFINNLPLELKQAHYFVLFLYEADQTDALSILELTDFHYEIRTLQPKRRISLHLPGRLRIINTLLNTLYATITIHVGDRRITDSSGLDAFLQFDPMQVLPKAGKLRRGLVLYDLIPFIMGADYLWNYRTARQHQHSRKGALRKAILRRQYIIKARTVAKQADLLFAISEYTKQDYVRFTGIKPSKISVVHLGITKNRLKQTDQNVSFNRYVGTSWGYFPKQVELNDTPFLLFLGGADPRRKLNHLVAAYNNLKAQGQDIRLVLAGDTMKGPLAIPVPEVQKYLASSSYLEGIVFLGFVTDEQRDWLYANALAMVYPSVYEGFGLPVLEAMQYGTPVITYKNTSIQEIAERAALYAHDAASIKQAVEQLLSDPKLRQQYQAAGQKQAAKFDWSITAQTMINQLLDY